MNKNEFTVYIYMFCVVMLLNILTFTKNLILGIIIYLGMCAIFGLLVGNILKSIKEINKLKVINKTIINSKYGKDSQSIKTK